MKGKMERKVREGKGNGGEDKGSGGVVKLEY